MDEIVDTNDVCDLLESLMKIDSTSGREANFGRALAKWLIRAGWQVKMQPVSRGDEERYNLYATRAHFGPQTQPKLILNTHLDTVPPYIPPTRTDDQLKGRGSCDAKAMIACMCLVGNRIVSEHPKLAESLALLFVVSEENGHFGMIEANELSLKPRFMIVGEPTEMKFATGHKGVMNVVLKMEGKAAHSGYPEMGHSAVETLLDVLHDIRNEKWPTNERFGPTTVNIGIIEGGQAVNALAAEATAKLLFRVVSDATELLNRVKKVVAGRALIQVGTSCSGPTELEAPPDKPTTVVAFGTDAPYLHSADTKTFLFGPGSITDAHSAWEYINLADLQQAQTVYYELAMDLLNEA